MINLETSRLAKWTRTDRRLRDRTLGFRLEKVSRKTPTLRLDSFCHRDQSGSGGRAIVGSWYDRLSAQSQERSSLPRTQSSQWGQRRSTGCLEFCRCFTGRWSRLESASSRRAADQGIAFTVSG